MKLQKKRGWIFGGVAALALIGTIAQLTTTHAQSDAANPAAPDATAAASTNLAPAELPKLPADLSPGLADVIKLTQSNVGDEVVVNYIKNSPNAVKPTADEILYLKDLGVSEEVISTLMLNGKTGTPGSAVLSTASVPPAQQIPTAPGNVSLSSPEVPNYTVTQDAPIGATVPPPDVPPPSDAPVVEQTPPPEVTVNYFYDSLAPYGSWVDVEGYGRCWRPSVAVVSGGWRPYCDNGYWVNTDAGWYWHSYYSWGWAPFHYGRWCSTPRYGWIWTPDCTWGPAWVAWREHDRYCGWAPLPPNAVWRPGVGVVWTGGHGGHVAWGFGLSVGAFTFVGYDHFTDHRPWRHQAPHNEVVNIYNHSTVINNTIIVNNKKTIINNGISKERITAVTHKPVQTVVLRDTKTVTANGRVERSGGKDAIAVYRPSATSIAKVATAPVNHNKPVLINSTRTASVGSASRTTFGAKVNNPSTAIRAGTREVAPTTHPAATPRGNGRGSADVRQTWPGENVNTARTQTTTPSRVAEANRPTAPATPNASTRFEPSVHSTAPSTPALSGPRTVEQPNNYGGTRAQATAPSASAHNAGAAPYAGGHGSSGVSPSAGHAGAAAGSSYGTSRSAAPSASRGNDNGKNR
jgi:hypothetical protein